MYKWNLLSKDYDTEEDQWVYVYECFPMADPRPRHRRVPIHVRVGEKDICRWLTEEYGDDISKIVYQSLKDEYDGR